MSDVAEKIYLSAPRNEFYGGKKETRLQDKVLEIQEEITKLQEKKNILNEFMHIYDTKQLLSFDFVQVEGVTCTHEWDNLHQSADSYALSEEIVVFNIQTNKETFSVMLECIGVEDSIQRAIYYLHTPMMNNELFELVRDAILNEIEQGNQIILLHPNTTIEKEKEKLFTSVTCIKEQPNDDWWKRHHQGISFEKGKMYRMIVEEQCVYVEYKQNELLYLDGQRAEQCFDVKCKNTVYYNTNNDNMQELLELIEDFNDFSEE